MKRAVIGLGTAVMAGVLAVGLSACEASVSVGSTPTVSAGTLAKQVAAAITNQNGVTPDSVRCAGSLTGKVDQTQTCRVAATGVGFDVKVTVTSVKGHHVKFDVDQSSQPTVLRAALAEQISEQLATQIGRRPERVTCPEAGLRGKVGTTARCTLTDSGQTYGITVTVTAVQGTNVKFDITVDDAPTAGGSSAAA